MPYYQRSWNTALGDRAPLQTEKLRTVPATLYEEEQAQSEQPPLKELTPGIDQAKLIQIQSWLQKQINELYECLGAKLISDPDFFNYNIMKEQIIFKGLHSDIYSCNDPRFADVSMMAREFRPTALIKQNDFFLKLLRRIGNQEPSIIQTMDIFVNKENSHIFLFQEFASFGNAFDYTKFKSAAKESQMLEWARSIYRAMDFLGNIGIVHRSIQPKHIFLKPAATNSNVIQAKLGSFRDAIVYWDPIRNDIIDQPCKPLANIKTMFFVAPETFSDNNEFYNPVDADVWSYGATMFYVVSRLYPFNAKGSEENIDGEIRNNIASVSELSDAAKYWVYGLLRTNTKLRTDFDDIAQDPWFCGQALEENASN